MLHFRYGFERIIEVTPPSWGSELPFDHAEPDDGLLQDDLLIMARRYYIVGEGRIGSYGGKSDFCAWGMHENRK